MILSSLAPALVVLYALVNAGVFCLYGYDKRAARTGRWRIPESTLLGAALVAPFGACGAMLFFRHKTRKLKFYLVPVFLAAHLAAILYLAGVPVPALG
ncbi:DUF1294 domain-containing protein [Methanoregula sp.]|uniref:DUF1294 domain-containing protein n=1 Tax=Methanoregula sp. TaxID=2052170 RepID=UPI002C672DDC|nr:DUF1294 domain-containing protein [Methanoregula sp.]HVP96191.1 DUF1294 domain-containing protein [Methanoregula sp.]